MRAVRGFGSNSLLAYSSLQRGTVLRSLISAPRREQQCLFSEEAAAAPEPEASTPEIDLEAEKAKVEKFLDKYGQKEHADKFTSFDHLLSCRRVELKKLGISTQHRKLILNAKYNHLLQKRWAAGENFFYSVVPSYKLPSGPLFLRTMPDYEGDMAPFGMRPRSIKHPELGWTRMRQRIGSVGEFRKIVLEKEEKQNEQYELWKEWRTRQRDAARHQRAELRDALMAGDRDWVQRLLVERAQREDDLAAMEAELEDAREQDAMEDSDPEYIAMKDIHEDFDEEPRVVIYSDKDDEDQPPPERELEDSDAEEATRTAQ